MEYFKTFVRDEFIESFRRPDPSRRMAPPAYRRAAYSSPSLVEIRRVWDLDARARCLASIDYPAFLNKPINEHQSAPVLL